MALDLPDDVVRAVRLRAVHEGRTLKDVVADLLRQGLVASDAQVPVRPSTVRTDPKTGLPYFECAANAPISRMSSEEIHAFIRQTQEEEDLERAGVSLRR